MVGITPVNGAYQPVSKTRPVSWGNVTRRVVETKSNDNPAIAITRNVPVSETKGQFLDLFS